ncbi:MAG: starch-binding protein [Reichenbachiella sp.]
MKNTFTIYTLLLGILLSSVSFVGSAQHANDSRVLMQGFYWESHDAKAEGWYNHVSSQAQTMSAAGFDMIWLPPPSDAASDEGYLPRQLSNLSNGYGNTAEHLAMLSNLNANGIEPIADIVINHRVGSTNWVDFSNPTWGTWSIASNDEVWGQPEYQGLERGNSDTGNGYSAARDIDHTNATVRQDIKNWLNELKAAGYQGWRYDLVHGYGASYINEYNTASGASFSVGEDWQDKQSIQNWINGTSKTSAAFDFPTYYALKSAIKDNNYAVLAFDDNGYQASGLIGWSPAQSVTFIENHDTPHYDTDNNILNGNNVGQAYAYLLTHPGVPTVFWPHYFDWGVKDELDVLIAIRKDNGIQSTSNLDIIQASSDVYAALIDAKVAVKIGSGNWSPSDANWSDASQYVLQASGNNYAIWVKGGIFNNPPVVSVDPEGPFSSGAAFDVTITATDDSGTTPTIYYTTNGDEPTTSNSMVNTTGTIVYNVATTQVLKVMSIDNEGLQNSTQTHQYTIAQVSNFSVYWKNPNPGSTPRIHHWGAQPIGVLSSSAWPGVIMTDATAEYGDNWYKYSFSGVSSTNLLFHNDQGYQSPDLSASGKAWYDGAWVSEPSQPTDTEAPIVTVSPAGGNYQNTVSVVITATDNVDSNPVITYVLDGQTFAASSSVTITIDAASTLEVSATDVSNNTSGVQSHDYTFNPTSNLVIHFKGDFSNPYLYHWAATPNGGASAGWPGSSMTAEGDGWYVFEIADADCSNIIFTDQGANKTADLNRCGEGWYTDGVWYDEKPVVPTSLTVYFKPNNYTKATVYFWGTNASTQWPGEQMTDEGNGWYSYSFSQDVCANLIFSNSGSDKTDDLNRCGSGWYENGNWMSTNPSARLINTTVGTETLVQELDILAYPNPSSYTTTFEYQLIEDSNVRITLLDVTGKELMTIHQANELTGSHQISFDVSGLDKGIYFYRLGVNDRKINKRLIIK